MRSRAARGLLDAVVTLVCIGLASPAAASSELAAILTRQGIRPLEPASAAPDFTLPRAGGGKMTLSEHHGRWVLLTFWATWCGPCLVELPSLQRLFETRGKKGFSVVAVAIGSSPAQVKRIVQEKGLAFDVLVDRDDQVAARYRAGSVPVSFLIDPSGQVVGVARGARDWSQADALVKDLTTLIPPSSEAEQRYQATSDRNLELPSNIVPPSAKAVLSDRRPEKGRPFSLKIHVRWAGNMKDYLLHPPVVHLPKGVIQEGMAASSSSRQGSQEVTYTVRLRSNKEGSMALDPIELRYTPHLEGKPVAERIVGPTATVVASPLMRPRTRWLFAVLGGLAFVSLGAGASILLRRRRRRASRAAEEQPSERERLGAALTRVHALRVAGDVAGFLHAAAALRRELGEDMEMDDKGLQTLLERVRYGGERPSDQELDRLERRLERAINERFGEPDALADEGIRLA